MGEKINWIDRIPGYHYYDTPDGEDCLQKVIYMNKLGLLFGVFAGSLDVVAVSKPVGFPAIAARYAACSFPLMAVGSTFAATSCLLQNIRGKDDTWNYSWGGFSAGCVAGAVSRSGVFGTAAATLFAAFGFTKKYLMERDILLCPNIGKELPKGWGDFWSIKYDFSTTEDRPRGWRKYEGEILPVK